VVKYNAAGPTDAGPLSSWMQDIAARVGKGGPP
jgi:hypothetical protein